MRASVNDSVGGQVERPCPVCNGAERIPLFSKGELAVVRCVGCGMQFASPVASRWIDGQHYEDAGSDYYTSSQKLAGDFSPVRYRRELAWFRRYCPRGRVLDVGCNTGAFLHQLQTSFPHDYDVLGLDVSGPALKHAATLGLPVITATFDDPAAPDAPVGPFDAITFWAVLEHVDRPGDFLRRAAALLAPGGHIFILVPNAQSLAMRLLGARYRYVMPEHLNYFSAATLRQLVRGIQGFSVVTTRTTHFNPVVLWQDATHPRKEVPATERAQLMNRTNAWKERPGAAPVRWSYAAAEGVLSRLGLADNLLMIARKTDHGPRTREGRAGSTESRPTA